MANVNLSLSDELLAEVDRRRGDVPRVRWIRRAIEAYHDEVLPSARGSTYKEALPVGHRARGVVSSGAAKRDVRPVPKGKS